MQTTFVRTPTSDGLLLQGLLHEPDGECAGAVLHVHGMGGNFYENRFLDAMARAYTDRGFALLAGNTRGRDTMADFPVVHDGEVVGSRRVGAAYERFAESRFDIAAWLDFLDDRGLGNVHLQGHSLGGSKGIFYLAETADERVVALVLLSATEMLWFAESQADHPARVEQARALVADGRDDELLPGLVWQDGYVLSAGTYLDFTERGNAIDVFAWYAPEAPATVGKVQVPILAVMGAEDEVIVAIGTTAQTYLDLVHSKATGTPRFDTYLPPCNHGYRGLEDDVARTVADWLSAV